MTVTEDVRKKKKNETRQKALFGYLNNYDEIKNISFFRLKKKK